MEIAGRHGVSIGTVRTHLKSAFAKTGTTRQAELAILLSRTTLA
jgi:DNA-binding CsgD family transcriptional regulator